MYSWIAFPLLRITLLFAAGIVLAIEFPPSISRLSVLLGIIVIFVIYLLIWWLYNLSKFYSFNLLFGGVGHLLIMMAGYAVLLFHNDEYAPDHLLYKQGIVAYQVEITDEANDKKKNVRVLGKLISAKDSIGWKPATGKLFIYIKKGETTPKVMYGDVLLIHGNPTLTQPPKNPGEFDYQQYLGYQNIYHQDFIATDEFTIVERQVGYSLYSFAIKSREFLRQILYRYIEGDRERAIALALLLGTKNELTPEINAAYSSAGVMHVLAVSGLHVGIIYGLMLFFFKNSQKQKVMKWVFLLATLGGLWSYALVTGLSASVLRAVAMFSLITIAKVAKREVNIYNTLSAAGLILLCYNPYMIMSVGFQLSFLAVFGIVYITPKIYKLMIVNQYVLDKIWELTCVSIAAQLVTLPLVLLYFHQFPTYFFLSNLVVIPAAFCILVSGIALFVFEMIPLVGDVMGFILERLIYWTNEFIFLIERLPNSTIDNLYINTTQSWLLTLGTILLFLCLYYKKSYQFVLFSLITLFFIIIRENRIIDNLQKKEIIFYSISQHTAIDFLQGDQAILIADSTLSKNTSKIKFHINPKRLRAGINNSIDTKSNVKIIRKRIGENEVIVWNEQRILILKKYSSQIEKIQVDIVVVADNSIYDLIQLATIDYRTLIIDGSNSRYRINRLMEQAQSADYDIINLMESGAYTVTL